MKTRFSLLAGLAGLSLILITGFSTPSFAAPEHDGVKVPAVDSVEAQKLYPLSTCVVSSDTLEAGDMGPIIEYVHQEAGQPDRLVRLCCKRCVKSFKKNPAKYLKMIDDAAAGKAQAKAPAAAAGHVGHNH